MGCAIMHSNTSVWDNWKFSFFDGIASKKFSTTANTYNMSSSYSPSTQTTQNYSPTFTKQIELIINSPDSTIMSKKEASSQTRLIPEITSTIPLSRAEPPPFQEAEITAHLFTKWGRYPGNCSHSRRRIPHI